MGEDTFEAVALELEALTHSTFTSAKIRSLAERLRMLALLPLPAGERVVYGHSLTMPDGSMIDACDLVDCVVGIQGQDFGPGSEPGHELNEVEEDEIDEDPPSEAEVAHVHITDAGVTTSGPVIVLDERAEPGAFGSLTVPDEEAFQRGYAAGQHDALDMLAGPVPNVGEQGPSEG